MRLLHIRTQQFREFHSDPPPYVVASHRWTADELTYQDMALSSTTYHVVHKVGYHKLLGFCKAMQWLVEKCPKLEVEWIWIDTCCIDKTNLVELQEALNSMFKWYAEAELCLVYLYDVPSLDQHPQTIYEAFRDSVWHKRCWCLQELLAPRRILFYNQDWEILGRKFTRHRTPWITARAGGLVELNSYITRATGVPEKVLWDFSGSIEEYSIEEKQSWMKGRSSTRPEDRVYSQLGIFGVFMPLIYGEGEHAMIRLEEAIAQKQRREAKRTAGPTRPEVAASPEQPAVREMERKFTINFYDPTNSGWASNVEVRVPSHHTVARLHLLALQRLDKMNHKLSRLQWRLRTDPHPTYGKTLDQTHSVSSIIPDELWMVCDG